MISTAMKSVIKEIDEHTAALSVLHDELNNLKAEQFFTCAGCIKRTKIKSMSLIQTHWYTRTNTGSGSFWTRGEVQVYCPKCDSRTSVHSDELREFISSRSSMFLETLDYYPNNRENFSIETLRKEAAKNKRGY